MYQKTGNGYNCDFFRDYNPEHYQVVGRSHLKVLAYEVEQLMEQGWKPFERISHEDCGPNTMYYQTMIKE